MSSLVGGLIISLSPYDVAAIHPRTGHVVRWHVLAANADDAMLRCDLAGMLALSAVPTRAGPASEAPGHADEPRPVPPAG